MGFFYLGLAFVGAVVPSSFLGQFLLTHGLNAAELKAQLWAGPVSSFTGAAFIIASLVNLFFVAGEGRRLKMPGLWLPLAATILAGVSCGLPLFLYLRGQTLVRQSERGAAQEAAAPPPAVRR